MSSSNASQSLEQSTPTKSDVALLALKFYIDSDFQQGHEWENLLCAEYMLAQKHLIQCQINAIHEGKPSGAA